jgi:hypothetical protein
MILPPRELSEYFDGVPDVERPEVEFLSPDDILFSLQRAEEIYREHTDYDGCWSVWREEVGRVVIQSEDESAATVVRTSRTELVEVDESGELGDTVWTARDKGNLAEAIADWIEG